MSKWNTTPSCWLEAPPMGWNSWDAYGASVTEDEVMSNAAFMQKNLLAYGWDTVIVDIQWSEPKATGWDYHDYAELCLDCYGRQLPASNRFPSAQGTIGFKTLAAEIHRMGLKFGVHLMRGIPRQAVAHNLPILGTSYTARDIVDKRSICAWNTDMYGLNTSHPGAQAYYDSVFDLFATWGVDYVKVDDIAWNAFAPSNYPEKEVELIHRAIAKTQRPMFLSLSPGPADQRHRTHFHHYANSWRITDDFWDKWDLVQRCLDAAENWSGESGRGSWPDADMLPLGRLRMRLKEPDGAMGEGSKLTSDESQLVFSLWCLFRSPLMLGADLPGTSAEMLSIFRQTQFLEWSQCGSASSLLTPPKSNLMIWSQELPLPRKPMVRNGVAAGPKADVGERYPILLVNRSHEELELNVDDILAKHWPLAHKLEAWYLLDPLDLSNYSWEKNPIGTFQMRPHSSLGFVMCVS